jgi:nucleoside-diphosphate kinase
MPPVMERTLALIKPDATAAGQSGAIIQRIEQAGFRIRSLKTVRLSRAGAEGFYAVHRARPFFASLTEFMSSGPIVALALEAPDAIRQWRTLMGATDPARADAGTIRRDFATSIERNATHGSDAPDTAAFEVGYFFAGLELVE